jgi:hypothetical protein
MNFAAENFEENNVRSDSPGSTFASNEGIDNTPHENRRGKVSVKISSARSILLLMRG